VEHGKKQAQLRSKSVSPRSFEICSVRLGNGSIVVGDIVFNTIPGGLIVHRESGLKP